MHIGDHVRALHSAEEGFITQIIDDNTVEIEIEDGFTILLLKKDVVLVRKEESDFFDQKEESQIVASTVKKSAAHTGVYLAFIPSSENFVDLHIVNNTDYQLLLTAHSISEKALEGLFYNTVKPKSYTEVNKWNIKKFEGWKDLLIDVLYYQSESTTYKSPLSKKIKFQAKVFFNNFKNVPLIDQKGYLYQVDQNVQKINSDILSSSLENEFQNIDIPESIIDLHTDQLPEINNIPSHQVLDYQLQIFQQKLDAAIATGLSEITFIHGSGSGTLKSKIQKQLSQHPHVAYYQDAQKNKFGYGATYVKIK